MTPKLKRKVAIGTAALAAAALAGGAYAASQRPGTPSRQALLDDVAKRLNVTPQQLNSALKGALIDRLNAAVKAGRLTQAQANAIEQRIQQSGTPPLSLGPPGFGERHGPYGLRGPEPHGALKAAAGYLGLSDVQLFDQLRSGTSLAQVAKARGKSVAGLEQAMIAAVRSRLDQAAAANEITKAREQLALSRLSARIAAVVNRTGPRFGRRHLPGPRQGDFPAYPGPPGGPGGTPDGPPGGPADTVPPPPGGAGPTY